MTLSPPPNPAQLLLKPVAAIPNNFLLTALSLLFLFSSSKQHHPFQVSRSIRRRFLRLNATMTQNPNPSPSPSPSPNLTSHPFPTPQSLYEWLQPRLPSDSFASWGTMSGTKNVHNLWLEIADGETSLVDTTPPVRSLEVVSIRVFGRGDNNRNRVLIESQQELSDGSIRGRGRPLSEKMKAGEDVESAAKRAIAEELGSILDLDDKAFSYLDKIVEIVPNSYRRKVEQGISKSYPGLPACYVMHTIDAFVEGLPKGDFVTEEDKEYGDDCCGGDESIAQEAVSVKRHFWRWVSSDDCLI